MCDLVKLAFVYQMLGIRPVTVFVQMMLSSATEKACE